MLLTLPDDEDAEDATLAGETGDEEVKTDYTPAGGACPRRVSTSKIPDKKDPIPNSTSLFVFKPGNR